MKPDRTKNYMNNKKLVGDIATGDRINIPGRGVQTITSVNNYGTSHHSKVLGYGDQSVVMDKMEEVEIG